MEPIYATKLKYAVNAVLLLEYSFLLTFLELNLIWIYFDLVQYFNIMVSEPTQMSITHIQPILKYLEIENPLKIYIKQQEKLKFYTKH